MAARLRSDAGAGLLVAAALVLLVFLTTGGTDLGPNTAVEIALVVLGGGSAAATLLAAREAPWWGLRTVALFAVLVALTAASIAWSVVPDASWLEANRVLGYLGAFSAAVAAARLAPGRWRALLGGVGLAAAALSLYALLARVFPGTLDPQDPVGRLRVPFDYWNATGLMAALGAVPAVWWGTRPASGRRLAALAPVALAVEVSVVLLSLSRSSLLVLVCALGLWLVLVPLRLRAALIIGLGGTGGAVLSSWALRTHALTADRVPLSVRADAGHGFGLVLVVVLGVLVLAGFAAAFGMDRVMLAPPRRRQVGLALLVALGLVPLGGIAALAASSRGLTGQISHGISQLTNPHGVVHETPGRLAVLANSRPRYWRQGLLVGEHSPLHGVGAGGFAVARGRYAEDSLNVGHAHSYLVEAFADLGILGLLVSLALLASWALAAARVFGRGLGAIRARPDIADPERIGMATLLCVVLGFGLQATIDWTWSIPGTAITALVCAGWLAGRGPLASGRAVLARRRLLDSPGLLLGLTGVATATLLLAWAVWQPLRSAQADAAADAALVRGDAPAALTLAREAEARDPLSPAPLWEQADALAAQGRIHAAHEELVRAISLQPENPDTWTELGRFNLEHHQPRKALAALSHAQMLEPRNLAVAAALAQAQAELARR